MEKAAFPIQQEPVFEAVVRLKYGALFANPTHRRLCLALGVHLSPRQRRRSGVYWLPYVDMIVGNTADSAAASNCAGGVAQTLGLVECRMKVMLIQALPLTVE